MIRVAMVNNAEDRKMREFPGKASTHYYFFSKAIPRHPKMEVDIIKHHGNRLDVGSIIRDHDVLLLPQVGRTQVTALNGILDINTNGKVPVLAGHMDPHARMVGGDTVLLYRQLGVDSVFGFHAPVSYYRFYPDDINYNHIPYGVEPSLYKTVRPWNERIDEYIGISGVMDKPDVVHWLYSRVYHRQPKHLSYNYIYKLRTVCNRLPYTMHTQEAYPGQTTANLCEALGTFKAAIVATTPYVTIKYMETPAAGCVTFMEATTQNGADTLGYQDGRTAMFINEKNYREKFQEYLDSPDDPKWRKIAEAGRKYTMENLTNDNAAEKLYRLMRRLLGEADWEPVPEADGGTPV